MIIDNMTIKQKRGWKSGNHQYNFREDVHVTEWSGLRFCLEIETRERNNSTILFISVDIKCNKLLLCVCVCVCVCVCMHLDASVIWLFVTLWTIACQVSLSMGFSRQEYWSGLPCPPPLNFPDPGFEPLSPTWQVDSWPLNHWGSQDIADGKIMKEYRSYWNRVDKVCCLNPTAL